MARALKERLRTEPFGLSRDAAAAHLGFSAAVFEEMVRDGRMPKPLLGGRGDQRRWARVELEEAFLSLPREGEAVRKQNKVDELLERRGAA